MAGAVAAAGMAVARAQYNVDDTVGDDGDSAGGGSDDDAGLAA